MDGDDSFDDDDCLQSQALIVDDRNEDAFDLDIPPTTGNEYLRRVRQEASQCPKVVVADLNVSEFNRQQTFQVQQPAANDVEGWCRLCFGRLQPPGTKLQEVVPKETGSDSDVDNSRVYHQGSLPMLSTILAMDQPTVIKVLEYHVNWFEATGFTEKQGCWFYALLLVLQKPLSPEVCSLLRTLARGCSSLRATLDSTEDPKLAPLNLLICLVARYFDQMDM
ncbi:hypothetical protein KUTeg_008345, partial [Tegillarca granosa]